MTKEIGNIIRMIRIERGYTQIQLAELLNITQASLSNIEQNKIKPRISTMRKLSNIFDYDFFQVETLNKHELFECLFKIDSVYDLDIINDNEDYYLHIKDKNINFLIGIWISVLYMKNTEQEKYEQWKKDFLQQLK